MRVLNAIPKDNASSPIPSGISPVAVPTSIPDHQSESSPDAPHFEMAKLVRSCREGAVWHQIAENQCLGFGKEFMSSLYTIQRTGDDYCRAFAIEKPEAWHRGSDRAIPLFRLGPRCLLRESFGRPQSFRDVPAQCLRLDTSHS
jgi:hypothetical protein